MNAPQDAERTQAEARLRRRVRWFVGGHLAAVGLIYAVALSIGGGHAPPPMPPDLAVSHRHTAEVPADNGKPLSPPHTLSRPADSVDRLGAAPQRDSAAASTLAQRQSADLAPHWVVESGGVVRIRHD